MERELMDSREKLQDVYTKMEADVDCGFRVQYKRKILQDRYTCFTPVNVHNLRETADEFPEAFGTGARFVPRTEKRQRNREQYVSIS